MARSDWLRDARWGVFMHYLAAPASSQSGADLPATEWNALVDGFDVDGLARQLADVRAPYLFITLGQNTGHYLSPNERYDSLVGRSPSRLSRRDLVADLARALEPAGTRLMVYLPSHAPAQDRLAVEGLGCTPLWDASKWGLRPGTYAARGEVDERLSAFQRNWEAVIREWSERWGRAVCGWWFDGCYYSDRMYRSPDEPNFASFAAAARAGNPDSIVAFNPGVKVPVVSLTEFEDYTAGEVAGALPARTSYSYTGRMERLIDGAQFHILTFMGDGWGRGEPRFPADLVAGFTRHVNDCGGAVTWDVPPTETGGIRAAFLAQLGSLAGARHPERTGTG
ncbi:MAG: hypothetical protein GF400_07955 [Candidatus Eisenbacteria bacterium]|nr:hypothetical protein [Candidatus Eisenbacteria bacterium]